MSNTNSRKNSKQNQLGEKPGKTLENLVRWTISYPFECCQTLMKLGYEPIVPRPHKFIGSNTSIALPNSFSYVRHMISVDGLSGCYRGFAPTIFQRIASSLVTNYLNNTYQPKWDANYPPGKSRMNLLKLKLNCNNQSPPEVMDILMTTGWRMLTVSLSTIVSHPLYVITVRMVAQFVGREARFMSFFNSLRAILREDGFFGLFKGLIPRLLSENIKIVVPAAMFLATTRIFHNRLLVNTATGMAKFFTDRSVFQLDVVSATMAIENSSMVLGKAPFITKKFSGWTECWTHLCSQNIQNRGRSSFFRFYNGPTTVVNGELRPKVYLGPNFTLPPLMCCYS